ncbi:MAG: thioredoxin domain-containing protein [Deltaproteobacteria bacterium]|nr:thioredoxin domain-containing protein [Deltaproteobacteria bacterium]
MRFAKTDMKFKGCFSSALLAAISIVFFLTSGYARGDEMPFPTYGAGAVQVRIYTDYFCPPCRGMEPALEPMLRDLIKRGMIQLTLVDTPFSKYTPLYARYFLYALNAKNDFEHALLFRNTLFDAATNRHFTTKERLEEIFKGKGIPWQAFEPKPAFDRYNSLIKEDNVDATPTCVIIRAGKKEKFVGGPDIINALKAMHP